MSLAKYKALTFLLDIYIILTSFTGDAICLKGNFCGKRYVNGRWVSAGNCERATKRQEITSNLKHIARGELELPICNTTVFTFPERNHHNYVLYNGTLPEMRSVTVCVWVKPWSPEEYVKGSIISYCTAGASGCNTFLVFLRSTGVNIYVNSVQYQFEQAATMSALSHLCIVKDLNTISYYINGTQHISRAYLSDTGNIPGGGVLIIGQDQDGKIKGKIPGPPIQSSDGLHGKIQGLELWNSDLNEDEITDLYRKRCSCANDSLIIFNSSNSIILGYVFATYNTLCG